jgi:hypothetical protein
MVRDDVAFNTRLGGHPPHGERPYAGGVGNNNNHYATAETSGVDLSTALKQTTQSGPTDPDRATAASSPPRNGVPSSSTAPTAMFLSLINHLCNDMER